MGATSCDALVNSLGVQLTRTSQIFEGRDKDDSACRLDVTHDTACYNQ